MVREHPRTTRDGAGDGAGPVGGRGVPPRKWGRGSFGWIPSVAHPRATLAAMGRGLPLAAPVSSSARSPGQQLPHLPTENGRRRMGFNLGRRVNAGSTHPTALSRTRAALQPRENRLDMRISRTQPHSAPPSLGASGFESRLRHRLDGALSPTCSNALPPPKKARGQRRGQHAGEMRWRIGPSSRTGERRSTFLGRLANTWGPQPASRGRRWEHRCPRGSARPALAAPKRAREDLNLHGPYGPQGPQPRGRGWRHCPP